MNISELYMVVNTDLTQERERTAMGNKYIKMRIFTDKRLKRSGHFFEILIQVVDNKRIVFVDSVKVKEVEIEERKEDEEDE